jgi:hypothetical protein
MLVRAQPLEIAGPFSVSFSVTADAAWAPGAITREAWQAWAKDGFSITAGSEPAVQAMPPMQRRRVGFLGRMALEVAYGCLGDRIGVPTVFCSRHGEVSRSVDLLRDLAADQPLSPASFGLSVHNATGGLFSIARGDKANNIALSAGQSSVEHAVIEACGLLADGENAVLLVVYDCPLPAAYANYQDCNEQAFAWAWLIEPPQKDVISLAWTAAPDAKGRALGDLPDGLQILRFHLRGDRSLDRVCDRQNWRWSRNV